MSVGLSTFNRKRLRVLPKWAREYIAALQDRATSCEITQPWTEPGMEWFTLLKGSEPEKLFLLSKEGAHCIASIGKDDVVFVGRARKEAP